MSAFPTRGDYFVAKQKKLLERYQNPLYEHVLTLERTQLAQTLDFGIHGIIAPAPTLAEGSALRRGYLDANADSSSFASEIRELTEYDDAELILSQRLEEEQQALEEKYGVDSFGVEVSYGSDDAVYEQDPKISKRDVSPPLQEDIEDDFRGDLMIDSTEKSLYTSNTRPLGTHDPRQVQHSLPPPYRSKAKLLPLALHDERVSDINKVPTTDILSYQHLENTTKTDSMDSEKIEGESNPAPQHPTNHSERLKGEDGLIHIYIDTSVQQGFHLKHLLSSIFPNQFYIHQFYSSLKYFFICDTSRLGAASQRRNRLYTDVKWLHDSMRKGEILPVHQYILKPTNDGIRKTADINEYLSRSRLHLLGVWKYEMTETFEKELEKSASIMKNKKKICNGYESIIAHIDMDCFFASVALSSRPHLKDRPVAVSHSRNGSGDISSCNYVARRRGLRAGMWIKPAKQICPDLVILPYELEEYKRISKRVYEILFEYFYVVQISSIDEAYVDLSYQCKDEREAMDLIRSVRERIEQETKCTASVGISENMFLAKMVTSMCKPNGSLFLNRGHAVVRLQKMEVKAIHGVGRALTRKLRALNLHTVADLSSVSKSDLISLFKEHTGTMLFNVSRGIDHRKLEPLPLRKSIGVEMNYSHRYQYKHEVFNFIEDLSVRMGNRLKETGLKGKQIVLKLKIPTSNASDPTKYLGTGAVDVLSKSENLDAYTDDIQLISSTLKSLYLSLDVAPQDVRGIGVSMQSLDNEASPKENELLKSFFAKPNSERKSNLRHHFPQKQEEIDREVFDQLPFNIQSEIMQVMTLKENITKGEVPKSKKRKRADNAQPSTSKKRLISSKEQQNTLDLYAMKNNLEDIDNEFLKELPPNILLDVLQTIHDRKKVKEQSKRMDQIALEVHPLNVAEVDEYELGFNCDKDWVESKTELSRMIDDGWETTHRDLLLEIILQFVRIQIKNLMMEYVEKLLSFLKEKCNDYGFYALVHSHATNMLMNQNLGDDFL